MKLYIKNMVCPRCIRVVREELQKLGLDVREVDLGEVTLGRAPSAADLGKARGVLEANGFALIEDASAKTIESIKRAVMALARREGGEGRPRIKDSVYIAREVGMEYHRLSALFSSVENVTIEQYLILQRVERVKELLKYGEMTLTAISYELGYSSVAHLSSQFKKVTGMTPTKFRSMTRNLRLPIDRVGR